MIHQLHIVPINGSAKALAGAYIQYSQFSETGQYRNIMRLPSNLKDGTKAIITIDPPLKARYWRIVTKGGGPVEISEFSFFSTDLGY